ncbi:MAG TPA: glycogen-binding domain-containing protein [Longimicrobiales bacterium]
MRPAGRTPLLLLTGMLAGASPVTAQRWAVDVYAGGTRYDALAAHTAGANIIANLRYGSARFSAYASAAAPMDGDAPKWSAVGATGRPSIGLRPDLRLGIDLSADGYGFRYDDGLTGTGVSTRALPVIALATGGLLIEATGGRHDHVFSGDAGDASRHLYEIGGRASIGSTERYAIAEVRSLYGSGQSFPMARLQVGAALGPAQAWGSAGRWFGDDLAETTWGAGLTIAIGRGEAWGGVRRDAPDPLYRNTARTTWNVGYSLKLGRRPAEPLSTPVVRNGTLILRLPREGAAPPSVAGEFSNWQPLPMQASGDEWVIEIAVQPGAYRFAFVGPDGDWFVPPGYPGRMSDDMGGHVVLVVVP